QVGHGEHDGGCSFCLNGAKPNVNLCAKHARAILSCSLLTIHCSLLTIHCSLLTAHCSLLTAHYSLLTAHCSLFTAHCSLFTALSRGPAGLNPEPRKEMPPAG